MFSNGDWLWSTEHRQPCKVVEVTRLWDEVSYHVWLSAADTVIRTSGARLARLDEAGAPPEEKTRFTFFGVRTANQLKEGAILALVGATVSPLPHQLRALPRAMAQDHTLYLLADEVGLGLGGTSSFLRF